MKKRTLFLTVALACSATVYYLLTPRDYRQSDNSNWQPHTKAVHPKHQPKSPTRNFYTLHADSHNSDELAIAAATQLTPSWTVEHDLFIAEGPTEDQLGNLYVSPIDPQEHIILLSLDGTTGERRWAITSETEHTPRGGGAPLILSAPEHPEGEIVYLSTYEKAVAVTPSGKIVWQTTPDLPDYKVVKGQRDDRHVFGLNYHPPLDALVGITANGYVLLLDRTSGESLLKKPYRLPGSAAKSTVSGRPGESLAKRVDQQLYERFGPSENEVGRFSGIVDALYGEGAAVSNYFAIDRFTGRIFVAASAPDAVDGTIDQRSEYGSLYALDLVKNQDASVSVRIVKRQDFAGGSGASPALSSDGRRVYTADNDNNVLAFDHDLNPLWTLDVGQTIAASISVSSENNELYAVSMEKIFKLIDHGASASLEWQAALNAFPELGPYKNINMTTPTIVANGIAVSIGSGFSNDGFTLPLKIGVGLLDRATGQPLSYTPAREESVSVTMVSSSGGYYLANSPIRRAVTRTLIPFLGQPLTGGISYYRPTHPHNLSRAAACAALQRIEAAKHAKTSNQKSAFVQHAMTLLFQVESITGARNLNLNQMQDYCTDGIPQANQNSSSDKNGSTEL